MPGDDRHRNGQPGRQRKRQPRRSPDQSHRVVEKQDQAERRQHVIEMVAAIKMPQRDQFQHDAEQQSGAEREHHADDEITGPGHEGRGEVGAHHVERTVRQIDEIHDAEHQRQSRRQQKQQQAELQSVQELFDDEQHGHFVPALTIEAQWQQRRRSSAAAAMAAIPMSLHRAFVVEAVLVVLDDGRDGFSESWPSASLTTSCR